MSPANQEDCIHDFETIHILGRVLRGTATAADKPVPVQSDEGRATRLPSPPLGYHRSIRRQPILDAGKAELGRFLDLTTRISDDSTLSLRIRATLPEESVTEGRATGLDSASVGQKGGRQCAHGH